MIGNYAFQECPTVTKNQKKCDFQVTRSGSLFLFFPQNDTARRHLADNVSHEAQWFSGGLVVEHSYAGDLAHALQSNGFTVQ